MATTADAEFGWELLRESHYSLTLDEINKRLKRAGFAPVSSRMYQHYHKLVRYGFATYLPINQLDVKTLQNPAWDAYIRARSLPRETNLPVILRVPSHEEVIQVPGRARRLSDAYVTVRVAGSRNIEAFTELAARSNGNIEIEFPDSGERHWAELESVTLEASQRYATVRLMFLTVEDAARLTGREILGDRMVKLRLSSGDDVLFGLVVQQLSWLYQASDSARAISEELLVEFRAEKRFAVSPPRISALSLASPLELVVEIAAPATFLLLGSLELARRRVQQRRVARDKKGKESITRAVSGQSSDPEGSSLVDGARSRLQEEIGRAQTSRRGPSPRLEGLWLNQLYPSAERLAESTEEMEIEEQD